MVSSRRTLADSPVRGFDYDYAYDPIGNRISATDYDEQGNPLVSSYSANALNQYTHRTVPGYATIRGEAATNATVTVNERPTFRQGAYFYGGDSADNTTSNLWKELEVYAAINPPGTNTPDVVYASTGTVFIAKTPEQFTYDADGNMTADERGWHYAWNGENRLVCASNDEVVVTYAYDHRGRMVRKSITHTTNSSFSILHYTFVWDDWNIIREVVREDDSVAVTDNIWGLDLNGIMHGLGGVGGLLSVVRYNTSIPQLYFPTYDANGNISEYVSTNGEIVAHYAYSPFGEPIVSSGPLATSFTHQFSTRPYCPHIEIIEYVYRKYRPEIGRWMNRDMLFSNQNAMLFALNKPVFRVDALGLYTPPEEMSFISQSQAAKADCNASIDTFWKNNPKWKSIREHFSRVKRNGKTCEVLITCTCCNKNNIDPMGKGGWFSHSYSNAVKTVGQIVICSDRHNEYERLFAHELVLFFDYCSGNDSEEFKCEPGKNDFFECICAANLCKEYRAYYSSGACSDHEKCWELLMALRAQSGLGYWEMEGCDKTVGNGDQDKERVKERLKSCDLKTKLPPQAKY